MRTRLLSIAIVSVFSFSAQAQLPPDRYSPLNYIGRFTGFGYSDGYHACKDERCKTKSWWNPLESMSSIYGSPTAPPTRSNVGRPAIASPVYIQSPYPASQVTAYQESMQSFHPQLQSAPTAQQQWEVPPQGTFESVPPVSIPLQPLSPSSPSDISKPVPTREPIPPARFKALPAPPLEPTAKVPQVTRSLIEPTEFRPRS